MADFFGPFSGEKVLTAGFTQVIDGLTTARYVHLSCPSTNLSDVLVQHKSQSGSGAGFRLRPGDRLDRCYIGYRNDLFFAKSVTAPGSSISYIGSEL